MVPRGEKTREETRPTHEYDEEGRIVLRSGDLKITSVANPDDPVRRACLVSRANMADKEYEEGDGTAGSSIGAGSNPIRILASALEPGLPKEYVAERLSQGGTIQVGDYYLRSFNTVQKMAEVIRKTQQLAPDLEGKVADLGDLRGGDTPLDGDFGGAQRRPQSHHGPVRPYAQKRRKRRRRDYRSSCPSYPRRPLSLSGL